MQGIFPTSSTAQPVSDPICYYSVLHIMIILHCDVEYVDTSRRICSVPYCVVLCSPVYNIDLLWYMIGGAAIVTL